ncbi:MAG: D-alanyl-D-alanine carboxypeptidase family protein [Gemmatimonadaceae bacterium]|nr:D-alanyl-D-alanine carboxypeptidase family protein [Gemmatimonadaceae bacterium]
MSGATRARTSQAPSAHAQRMPWPARLAGAALLVACAPATPAPRANTAPLPIASDAAAESLLVDVQALEPSIRVRARYAGRDNFTGAPLPGYEADRALLRREAATALARVQRRLAADGLGLLVWDGYRPVRATLAMVRWTEETGRASLVRDGYIASRSRHNLGLAVDLTLVTLATGAELDMGTPFDTFDAAAHTANAAGTVRVNRTRLVRAMEAEGFRNYDQEWWHFSYDVPDARPFDRPIVPR